MFSISRRDRSCVYAARRGDGSRLISTCVAAMRSQESLFTPFVARQRQRRESLIGSACWHSRRRAMRRCAPDCRCVGSVAGELPPSRLSLRAARESSAAVLCLRRTERPTSSSTTTTVAHVARSLSIGARGHTDFMPPVRSSPACTRSRAEIQTCSSRSRYGPERPFTSTTGDREKA